MASEMLQDPDIQLIDVAMTLGYENQSNFGRSFRRIAGISPGKYRRQMLIPDRVA
jgi:AraC-like DNA-binding protein